MLKLGPLGVLVLFLLTMSALALTYGIVGAPPSEAFQEVLGYGSSFGIIHWVVGDAERRRSVPCFDFGWLVLLFYPVSVAWYVISTRGLVRGAAMLVLLIGLRMVPTFFLNLALVMVD